MGSRLWQHEGNIGIFLMIWSPTSSSLVGTSCWSWLVTRKPSRRSATQPETFCLNFAKFWLELWNTWTIQTLFVISTQMLVNAPSTVAPSLPSLGWTAYICLSTWSSVCSPPSTRQLTLTTAEWKWCWTSAQAKSNPTGNTRSHSGNWIILCSTLWSLRPESRPSIKIFKSSGNSFFDKTLI